ncbi:adenylosuccinate synthetase [Candidatus Woesebacteria bacterium]|nr:adenylosuccinate synthetase [Candidatus Woesebacteria bacterium]
MPWHQLRDNLRETARGGESIGTTGKGIGPVYADRTSREGLQMLHLLLPEEQLREKLFKEFVYQSRLVQMMSGDEVPQLNRESFDELTPVALRTLANDALSNSSLNYEDLLEYILAAKDELGPYIQEILPVILGAYDSGSMILGEGAQGALLDLNQGTYPFVTSSHPTRAGFSTATGIYNIANYFAASRAYTARVGGGTMPTELFEGPERDELLALNTPWAERGTTTGRLRRVGWFDAVAVRYGARVAGATSIALTKLDVMDKLPEVKIAVGYEVDGRKYGVNEIPTIKPRFLDKARPIYEKMPGWESDTQGIRVFEDLPQDAQAYVLRIQELIGLPISFVSVGPSREQMIVR